MTIQEKFMNEINKRNVTWTTREELEERLRVEKRKNEVLREENRLLYNEKENYKGWLYAIVTSLIIGLLFILIMYIGFNK